MEMKQIVRAIDVGYGNTKFIKQHVYGRDIECDLYPSFAPLASHNDLSSGVLQRRNTIIVRVNESDYEIGKDSRLALGTSHGRTMDDKFATSDDYLALSIGAMHYMENISEIDLLVLGLPVSTLNARSKDLQEKMKGEHQLPGGRTVTVRSVLVLPQPLGGFLDFTISNGLYKEMKPLRNLIIDPGYKTLDWLLVEDGKPIDVRSGAHPGGMFSVCRAVADAIGKELGDEISELTTIDSALRKGDKLRFHGHEYDIKKQQSVVKKVTGEAIAALAQRVQSGIDIDNIILAGGASDIYENAIREKFPKHQIHKMEHPVYANVRGFQLAGVQWMLEQNLKKQRAAARNNNE